ncbi:uncharacterized protein AB675_1629 [Cyphellophora attinorum]|uniref:Beta-lactamase-related domain-containing protein n=1 Tax=Cyphellophora attinorum TaxID=1664694 RepID=A0A0N0NIP3_9EURO|nr:uncharacterized protein AB675_1629 [Phialophora attinorum]KPI36061.1 hypothetical protein AB675_1629 [Phialophora attinorum]
MQYNNMMYGVLGQVIETVTGQSFNQVLRERLLDPLGMDGTWLGIERASVIVGPEKSKWSRPYHWRDTTEDNKDPDKPKSNDDDSEESGLYYPSHWSTLAGLDPAGALISSVRDYAKWIKAMLEVAEPPPEAIDNADGDSDTPKTKSKSPSNPLTTHLFRTLTTPLIAMPTHTLQPSPLFKATPNAHAQPIGYAMGWYSDPHVLPGDIMISHGGGLPGVATVIAMLPNHDFGMVLAGNSSNANLLIEAVTKELMGRRAGWSEGRRRKHHDDEAKKKAKEAEARVLKELEDMPGPGSASENDEAAIDGVPSESFDKLDFAGKYHHAAYGTFTLASTSQATALSQRKPTLEDRDMLRPKTEPKDIKKPKLTVPPLVMAPLGRRGLVYRFLLHPSTSKISKHPKNVIPLSMEWAISHGEFSECSFPELDKGWGLPDNDICPGPPVNKREGIWETTPVKPGAGALIVSADEDQKTRRVLEVGMRLARVEDPPEEEEPADKTDGTDEKAAGNNEGKQPKNSESEKPELEDGWQNRMVWFTRVLE